MLEATIPPAPMPTIGRRVYFWPRRALDLNILDYRQPFDAGVVFVHSLVPKIGLVNLIVTDHLGRSQAVVDVPFGDFDRPLAQIKASDYERLDAANGYADWMPYQKGTQTPAEPPGTKLLGANEHGIGPDVGDGPNPHFKGG